ncbi:putative Phosphatidylethanolamine binding protein [Melia azedarach]|uniref:Phosphatidylethanolamine binding protein n=1 Tax=Melia azedarach TaxID=155640 RepID=A0ACC1X0F0_MELAZ|nr:putative Phosphatidylethanolamine binding protein [Melia azedarach]
MASDEFRLVSPDINHEGRLPRKYTGEGQGAKKNISPPLEWVFRKGFSGKEEELSGDYAGIKEGNNDWKIPGWRGPKLPNHGHRFQFKLYALDEEVNLGNRVTKERLLEAIQGHVLGEAVLTAIF